MSVKKRIGQVTKEQRDSIQRLHERKNSLCELLPIIDSSDQKLRDRIVADMEATEKEFQQWWDDRVEEYGWEKSCHGRWEIDFNTCDIFLVEKRN